MTDPNGWHHNERVFIQAYSGEQVLVQYTERALLPRQGLRVDRNSTATVYLPPICPWAWLPVDAVVTDAQVRRMVKGMAG
jgi:hypothetical protein